MERHAPQPQYLLSVDLHTLSRRAGNASTANIRVTCHRQAPAPGIKPRTFPPAPPSPHAPYTAPSSPPLLTYKHLHVSVSVEVSHQHLALDLTHLNRPTGTRAALWLFGTHTLCTHNSSAATHICTQRGTTYAGSTATQQQRMGLALT